MRDRDIALLLGGVALAHRPSNRTVEVRHYEHRAPTDESVALLKEMQEKAEASVINAVKVEGNGFTCVVHPMYDGMSDDNVLRAIFDLNGVRMKVEARGPSGGGQEGREKLVTDLRDEMAKQIANAVLSRSLRDVRLPG